MIQILSLGSTSKLALIYTTQFKMYCEEMSTAEIVKKIGGKITYIPQLEVIHNEHSSINKIKRKTIFELAKESHKYFIQKYLNN